MFPRDVGIAFLLHAIYVRKNICGVFFIYEKKHEQANTNTRELSTSVGEKKIDGEP